MNFQASPCHNPFQICETKDMLSDDFGVSIVQDLDFMAQSMPVHDNAEYDRK